MTKTIGVLAHVDAGKTTFSEALLYHGKAIRQKGRVDHKDALLDFDDIEKERGITVFSGVAHFAFGEDEYYLVDTPGHVDFSGEMERTLGVLDYAVLLLSASDGIQGHTAAIWRLLERHNIPTFLFLNKCDQSGADPDAVLRQVQQRFSQNVLFFPQSGMDGTLAEALAERDDVLLETYLDTGFEQVLWLEHAAKLVQDRAVFPCFFGSALRDEGVLPAFEQIHALTKTSYASALAEDCCARVYQVRHDARGNRLSFLKVMSGNLQVKQSVNTLLGWQKIDQLRCYSGAKFQPLRHAEAGTVCAALGLSVPAGDSIGAQLSHQGLEATPTLMAKVLFDAAVPPQTILEEFRILELEEPLLQVTWEEQTQEIRLQVMGPVQLEVLQALMRTRFGQKVQFGDCEVAYRETIAAPVVGYGHFEPLRHYAEVHLLLSPGPRGSGITFQSACPLDQLDRSDQNLVKTHVLERQHKGVLIGAPLTDVQVTLLAGRAHLKHTEGGDFRQATYRAVRQGLMQAQSILLEPWYHFEIQVHEHLTGRVLSDIQRLQGSFDPPEPVSGLVRITGRAPVAGCFNYGRELAAYSQGQATLSFRFDGFEPCRDQQQVMADHPYQPEADLEHTPDSVFCSHGAGFTVKWQDVPQYKHIP